MNLGQLENSLKPFLPEGTAQLYCRQIAGIRGINFKLTRERLSKHGDYRSNVHPWRHQISINITLQPFHFLITLLHETAHLMVHENFREHGEPHGSRWNRAFSDLIVPYVQPGVLPQKLAYALRNHVANGYATTTGDPLLLAAFRELDGTASSVTTLEKIPEGAVFALKGQLFRKGERLRTFFKCYSLTNEKDYRVRATAEVELVEK